MRKPRPLTKRRRMRMYNHPSSRAADLTPEKKRRMNAYYRALGHFVHVYALVEAAMALTLWHYAKTPHHLARALFSGVRVRDGIDLIKRAAIATNASQEAREELKYIFDQLGAINSARNDILHYGAGGIADETATVTNALKALSEDRITIFPISPILLADMIADVRKIIVHLRAHHIGRPVPRGTYAQAILSAPWRYKHQPRPLSPTNQTEDLRVLARPL